MLRHVEELLAQHPVIDGHNDLPMTIREAALSRRDVAAYDLNGRTAGDTDIPRMRTGRLGGQFWSVWVPSSAEVKQLGRARIQLEQIDLALRMIERYPQSLQLALTADDIERANREDRIASLLGMEGGHAIENSLGALRDYYRLGVRYMTLTHSDNHDWADASPGPSAHGGLTRFGVEVVREMNRLGMLVDISHVSADTMNDVLDVAEAPVIFSHSNAKALNPHERNVPDEVLRRLPLNGGVLMISFITYFTVDPAAVARWDQGLEKAMARVGIRPADSAAEKARYLATHPEPRATLKDVANHIDYVRKAAGIDHVGIGSDFYGEPGAMAVGLEDTSKFPALFAELARRGWKDDELIKLARGNLLRALRLAEQVAARSSRLRPASFATIEELDRGQSQPDLY